MDSDYKRYIPLHLLLLPLHFTHCCVRLQACLIEEEDARRAADNAIKKTVAHLNKARSDILFNKQDLCWYPLSPFPLLCLSFPLLFLSLSSLSPLSPLSSVSPFKIGATLVRMWLRGCTCCLGGGVRHHFIIHERACLVPLSLPPVPPLLHLPSCASPPAPPLLCLPSLPFPSWWVGVICRILYKMFVY